MGRIAADKRPDVMSMASDGTVSVLLAKRNGTLSGPKERTVPGGDSYNPTVGDSPGNFVNEVNASDATCASVDSELTLLWIDLNAGRLLSRQLIS